MTRAGHSAESSAAAPARVVLVDKPVGPTSFDIVRAARRGVSGRVGHAGTLDPFASGLLVVLIGPATRLSDLLMRLPKEYDLTVQFGAVSSTADPTGEITPTGARTDAREVAACLDRLRGRIRQRVPMTSAVKVAGEALYKRAHRGETVETPVREVMVYDLQMVEFDEQTQTARLLALTGHGTYLRTLAEDMGALLGSGGYAAALRRSRIGGLRVADALQVEDLSPERLLEVGGGVLSVDQALGFLPELHATGDQARLAANGNTLPLTRFARCRIQGPDGLLAVYGRTGEEARPVVVLPGMR